MANEPTNGGDGEGMSQSAIDSMVAGLIPGWGGPKCAIDGAVSSCHLAYGLLASGAAEECLDGNCGKPFTARLKGLKTSLTCF